MTPATAVILFLLIAIVAANLPWLSERVFFVREPKTGTKSAWVRLAEWFTLYLLVGALGLGLEQKIMGNIHTQGWEFYVVTLCLFLVFALPGFIFRYDLKKHLDRR
jgi:succinate dehydrogenase hydrophobic anchor subunit